MFDTFDDDTQDNDDFSVSRSSLSPARRSRGGGSGSARLDQQLASCEYDSESDSTESGPSSRLFGVQEDSSFSNLNSVVNKKISSLLARPLELIDDKSRESANAPKSLREKLVDLYLEESRRNQPDSSENMFLNNSTNLLHKLLQRESYNTVVLNLYAANRGYSIGFNIHRNCAATAVVVKQESGEKAKMEVDEPTVSVTAALSDKKIERLNKVESRLLSYDETGLFYYINMGEIPPIMIDLIDRLDANLFYDGCIIMQVRDFRTNKTTAAADPAVSVAEASAQQCQVRYLLLRPSTQTFVADLNSLTNDGNFIWYQEDKYALESQLLLATSEPLCLNPSLLVSLVKNKLHSHQYKLNDRLLKRRVNRFSQASLNRCAKWHEFALPSPFKIVKIRRRHQSNGSDAYKRAELAQSPDSRFGLAFDGSLKYLHATQTNMPVNPSGQFQLNGLVTHHHHHHHHHHHLPGGHDKRLLSTGRLVSYSNLNCVDNWSKKTTAMHLPQSDSILVKKFSKPIERPLYTDEPLLKPVEEIIMEATDPMSKNNYTKLVIKRRTNNGVYFCQLSLQPNQTNDVVFRLGMAYEAEKYVQQYVKIFTEEGRRPVSIKHNIVEKQMPMQHIPTMHSLQNNKNLLNLSEMQASPSSVSAAIISSSSSSTSSSSSLSAASSASSLSPSFNLVANSENGVNQNFLKFNSIQSPVRPLVNTGLPFQNFLNSTKNGRGTFHDKQIENYQLFLKQQQQQQQQQQHYYHQQQNQHHHHHQPHHQQQH